MLNTRQSPSNLPARLGFEACKGLPPEIMGSGVQANSTVNSFIPVFHEYMHYHVPGENQQVLYSVPKIPILDEKFRGMSIPYNDSTVYNLLTCTRSYESLINLLANTNMIFKAKFIAGGEYIEFSGGRGLLMNSKGEVLFALAISSKDFIGYVEGTTSANSSNTVLFTSREFLNDPIYTNMRKRLEPYFQSLMACGIDEIITNNITQWLYSTVSVADFKSISERNMYFSHLAEKYFK